MSENLLDEANAAQSLDAKGAWTTLRDTLDQDYARSIMHRTTNSPLHPQVEDPAPANQRPVASTPPARRPPELGITPFAVLDVETTGFSPRLHDRVVEIAIVRTGPDGTVEDSWSTLLNPERDLGPTHIHGIRGADVLDAPRFVDIAGDVAERLGGAVVVAHNARFDLGFVTAEYQRIGVAPPTWPALCTLGMSYGIGRFGGGRLANCLAAEGLGHPDAHSALGDATATAGLLAAYLGRSTSNRPASLMALGCVPVDWPDVPGWPNWPASGRTHGRPERWRPELSALAQLVRHLPAHDLSRARTPIDTAAYLDLLDRALEDRLIDTDEVQALAETAEEWGLRRDDVEQAHGTYLRALAVTALADGVLTDFELTDLADVASALGLGAGEIGAALHEARSHQPSTSTAGTLRGLGVCFTGTLQARLNGQLITREQAQGLARAAGLVVHGGVTKSLDVLVVADPNSLSGKAKKARTYGTRIIAEAAFWPAIGLTMD